MARSGVLKSEIQSARDRLVAQGRHPSIDAVRAELGNTGSKTTIQRYLRELEAEAGTDARQAMPVSDALQDLVGRLASQLKEEAERKLAECRLHFEAEMGLKEEMLAKVCAENAALGVQIQAIELALRHETSAHSDAQQALAKAMAINTQLALQVANLEARLKDNEAHRQSLEEKHLHAREALDHYRQSVKDQREQDQRRHEHQVQQLQMEARTLNQTVVVKQNELTQLYQALAKETAELVAARKEMRRMEADIERIEKAGAETLRQNVVTYETAQSALAERIRQFEARCVAADGTLNEQRTRLHEQALELVALRTRTASQEEMLTLLKMARADLEEKPVLAQSTLPDSEQVAPSLSNTAASVEGGLSI
ncbi:DNA-binding protein [Chitinimonas sp. BJB300]|uniref:DNA-binding protein n=1 Tax=Chitinimonas sp. BJB300 TaxID=1559339 RepID=UPI001304752A|nr:DNA-binding protein [Chitinimonas sp. BJB300]